MTDTRLEALVALWKGASSKTLDPPYSKWTFDTSQINNAKKHLETLSLCKELKTSVSESAEALTVTLLPDAVEGWFVDTESFFKKVRSITKTKKGVTCPSPIFIEELGDNPEQRETIIAGTNNYILWNELLSKISDHSEYDKTTLFQSFIFISEDEKSKKIRKEILLFKPNQEVLSFITSIKEPKYKRDDLESVNIHAFERRSVLRLSLIEELKKHGDNNTFIESLISSPEILFSTFEGNYETYIRKFSLDKLAQEIEKEKLEALEKINKQLQEHQTKSLAIPGILIGTSLIKEWHFGTATLAFMAVAITALIFRLSIKNRRDSILEICDRTKHIIKIVDAEKLENSNLDQSSARALIEETNKSIITKKQAALRTLNYISKLIAISIIFWCVFLLYSVVPNLFFIIERFYPAALASIAPLANEFIYEIQNIYFHSTQSFK